MQIKTHPIYRIIIFLPVRKDLIGVDEFLRKFNDAVPVSYGDYDSVAYYSVGMERYRPLDGSKPEHGDIGDISELPSVRIEVSIPRDQDLYEQALQVIMDLHPWEKPVLQIYEAIETIEKA